MNKRPSLIEISRHNQKTAPNKNKIKPYNPYEGQSCGRQLNETVPEFLNRLPPETTPWSLNTPWIYIANPFRKKPSQTMLNSVKIKSENIDDQSEEGAMAEECDWAQFVVKGGRLLDELRRMRSDIEKENPGKAKATITKRLNPLKEELVQKILSLAVELKCTSGKVCLHNAVLLFVCTCTDGNIVDDLL